MCNEVGKGEDIMNCLTCFEKDLNHPVWQEALLYDKEKQKRGWKPMSCLRLRDLAQYYYEKYYR